MTMPETVSPILAIADEQKSLLDNIVHHEHLDRAVEEVFAMMLASDVRPAPSHLPEQEHTQALTAVIGLAGEIHGAFTLIVEEDNAMAIASLLLGTEVSEVDQEVFDAIGEMTNILAGAWKSKVAGLHAGCLLAVPTIVAGSSYGVHLKTNGFNLTRYYVFADTPIRISIAGESA